VGLTPEKGLSESYRFASFRLSKNRNGLGLKVLLFGTFSRGLEKFLLV